MPELTRREIQVDIDTFGKPKALSEGMYRANLNGQAKDQNDHVLYDTDSGRLYYDADGVGGEKRTLFAIIQNAGKIDAADFAII